MTLGVLTRKFWELSTGVYDNEYLKDTKFGRLMKRMFEVYEGYTGKLYLIPAFSFSLLNLYLLAVSYLNRDADWVVRETLKTYGRAMRDMIMNSWDIPELRKLDEGLVEFGKGIFDTKDFHSVLFPIHLNDEEKRAKTYELIGLIFTSAPSNKTIESISEAIKSEHYSEITDINIVAGLARDIFNAYDGKNVAKCGDMVKSKNLEGTLDSLTDEDSGTEIEVTPLDLIILTFNDMLNTNVDTSFKFINKRLLNNHVLRQMVYSLYARFFLDFVLDFGPKEDISRSLGFGLELYLLDSVREVFTGLSGNLRILDDIIMWQGEGGNQYSYALKILNVGIKGEEIFDLWLEIRRDVGISNMDSLLFIPMYPEQNLYGAWEKFNLDKRLAKVERREGEGNVVVLTLNHLYDLIRIMLINVENEPEYRAFEVFEQIVKENLL